LKELNFEELSLQEFYFNYGLNELDKQNMNINYSSLLESTRVKPTKALPSKKPRVEVYDWIDEYKVQ
jgi:hypothetical protein